MRVRESNRSKGSVAPKIPDQRRPRSSGTKDIWTVRHSIDLFRAELYKVFTSVTTYGCLAGVLIVNTAMICGVAWLTTVLASEIGAGPNSLTVGDFVTVGVSLGQVLAMFVGVQAYSTDCIGSHATVSFTVISRRRVLLIHKTLTVGSLTFLTAVISTSSGLIISLVIAGEAFFVGTSPSGLVLGAGLYLAFASIIGLGIAALLQNSMASVLVLLTFGLLVGPVLSRWSGTAGLVAFLPDRAGSQMLASDGGTGLSPLLGGLSMAAWCLLTLLVASIRHGRKDVA